jgi:hypothetical protein
MSYVLNIDDISRGAGVRFRAMIFRAAQPRSISAHNARLAPIFVRHIEDYASAHELSQLPPHWLQDR